MGEGRCYLHGGLSEIKHGRYSKITRMRLRDLITDHAADPAPLDTMPELAAARALFQDFVERYDEVTDALIAWHSTNTVNAEDQAALYAVVDELEEIARGNGAELTEQQQEKLSQARRAVEALRKEYQRPKTILDISDAYRIVSEITKIVERIEKATNSITYDQLKRFLFGFDRILSARIADSTLLEQIRGDLLAVAI